MATKADSPSSPGSPTLDDPGLWMMLDHHPDPRPCPTSTQTQGLHLVATHCAVDEETADDVFLPPSPRYDAPPPPGGARPPTQTPVHDPCVSCAGGEIGEVTQAKGNPPGLGRHPAEGQTVAEHSEVADEVTGSGTEENWNPEGKEEPEDMETKTPCEEEDSNASQETEGLIGVGDIGTLAQTGSNASEEPCSPDMEGRRSEDPDPDEEYKAGNSPTSDIGREEVESGDPLPLGQAKHVNQQNNSPGECEDTSSVAAGVHSHGANDVGTAGPDCLASNVTDLTDIETSQEENRCPKELQDNITEVPDVVVAEVGPDQKDCVNASVNYGAAKEQWGRRQSDDLPSLPTHLAVHSSTDRQTELLFPSPEPEGRETERDGCAAISSVIQQGELLLQRLQWVQDRQDTQPPGTLPAEEERGKPWNEGEILGDEGEGGAFEEELRAEHRFAMVEEEEEDGQLKGKVKSEKKEEGDNREMLAAMPVGPTPGTHPHHRVPRIEDTPRDGQSDSGVSANSPINTQGVPTTAGTHVVENREINQNLQKAGLLFNPTDNPDVLEIPFKNPILLKQLQGQETGMTQNLAWQFSEQKMQKEISQEHQRELVLVNQGTIPGEYRREGTRQLKETKRLFEGLQQGSVEGAARISRTPFTDPVYPSVLERTRSMEVLSLGSQPICRTQSLRVPWPEGTKRDGRWRRCRSRSPVAGQNPYPRQDQLQRHHRSMDSLGTDAQVTKEGSQNKTVKPEPFLAENPFFKLRPALAHQPEVQKDIQESRERDEELRRQRCTLYGESSMGQEEEDSAAPQHNAEDARQQSKGKLDRIWPPPPRACEQSSGQTQGSRTLRPGGHVTGLWQHWEAATRPSPNTDQS